MYLWRGRKRMLTCQLTFQMPAMAIAGSGPGTQFRFPASVAAVTAASHGLHGREAGVRSRSREVKARALLWGMSTEAEHPLPFKNYFYLRDR